MSDHVCGRSALCSEAVCVLEMADDQDEFQEWDGTGWVEWESTTEDGGGGNDA